MRLGKPVEYSQSDSISATDMGWCGVDAKLAMDPKQKMDYIHSLEGAFGVGEKYSRHLSREIPWASDSVQKDVLGVMCFQSSRDLLEAKIRAGLKQKYKLVVSGGEIDPEECVYRDPETKDLVIIGEDPDSDAGIDIYSENSVLARRLMCNSISETAGRIRLEKKNITRGLEDLTRSDENINSVFWDLKTKGLIGVFYGYDMQIPEYAVETTLEINIGDVVAYLKNYLSNYRIDEKIEAGLGEVVKRVDASEGSSLWMKKGEGGE